MSRQHRFSLGVDSTTGRYVLSIPVTVPTRIADYKEFYAISRQQYRTFSEDPVSALPFVDECRRQQHDDLMLNPPPATNRGTAV